MGLFDLIPPDNKLGQLLMGVRQPLNDIGVGLTRGKTWQKGLREASKYTEEQAPLRAEQAQLQLKAQNEANAKNSTAAYLRAQPGGAQFADAIEQGGMDGATAFKSWLDASKGQQPIEINGQLVDPKTFEVLGDFRTPETNTGPAPPAGYRWNAEGGLEFIPGGPQDPANAASKPPTDADVRAAKLAGVIQGDKELLLGPNGIYDKLADPWSQAVGAEVGVGGIGVGRPGLALTAPDYQSATNALTNIAQSYLYAISGQAAPAGEVAKIIESVTPKFGEDASSVKNKKARLASYIAAIEASKYDVPTGGGAGGGDAEIEGILTGLGI